MVAEEKFRGKGIAERVVQAMERYGAAKGRKEMIARIKKGNEPSLRLFKKMSYEDKSFSENHQ